MRPRWSDHRPPPSDAAAGSESDEIENFAARRKRLQARRKQARRSGRWTTLILVLLAFNVALIGARREVVRFLPQTASLFSFVVTQFEIRQHANFEGSSGRPVFPCD
jgi:hypothetical protein